MKLRKFSVGSLASLLAVLYPFFNYYGYGFVTLSFLLALLLFVYAIRQRGYFAIVQPLCMILYVLYFGVTRFLYNVSSLYAAIAPSIIFIFLLGGFLNREVILNNFLRFYRIIVLVNIAFLFFQESLYYASGYRIIGILSFLPLTNIGGANFEASQYAETASMAARSSAFFSEPAHFVQFLLPLLTVELFYVRNKTAYVRSCVYAVALLVLASGNAVLGLGVIGIFLILYVLKHLHPLVSMAIVTFSIIIVVVSVNMVMETEYGEKLVERVEELEPDQTQVSSGFIRIFRGYYIWDEMDIEEKLIGINSIQEVGEKINSSKVALAFADDDYYMNVVQSIMVFTGCIGVLIFTGLLIYLWKGNNWAGRCCIAIYIALGFIASLYFSYTMLLYLLVALLMKKENSNQPMRVLMVKFV